MSQYYIARIRYQNPLPPPPFPPKLLSIPTPIDPYTTPEYTSTLAQQQPHTIDLDAEGGMPLDLAIIPGLFEGDESGLYADPLKGDLHPKDRALLKTPESATTPSRAHTHIAVPFLRRTEYIASEKHATPASSSATNVLRRTRRPSLQVAQQELDHLFEDPEAQVHMIEETFRVVQQEEWIGKAHPRKRGIKCVDSWEFLPDRERVAQEFLLVRIQDDHISNTDDDSGMDVGILKPQEEASFGSEWVFSTYIPDSPTATSAIKHHLSTPADDVDDAAGPFSYTRVRDYEGNLVNPAVKSDFAVFFLNDWVGAQKKGAYFVAMSGKSNLKRRRTTRGGLEVAGDEERPDVIRLMLREETDEEREFAERKRTEFEEGGPHSVEQVESLEQVEVDSDDELSD